MKKVVSKKKKLLKKQPPIPVDGWLKLWLKIIDKEMDDFHVEDFKQEWEK